MRDSFTSTYEQHRIRAEWWMGRLLPAAETLPRPIHEAVRYSVFAGGKRFRAVLALSVAEALGAVDERACPVACAFEMIHTYSLIHDDLPSMDDDDLRRGKPTSHKVYGEAVAILAGDALLTLALGVLARHPGGSDMAHVRCRVMEEATEAAGTPNGMLAGQVWDITSHDVIAPPADHPGPSPEPLGGAASRRLHVVHRLKTGAMVRGAARSGAIVAGARNDELEAVTQYAEALGMAFQISDDILDVTSTREAMGKTPGKDSRQGKLTYPAVYGLDAARRMAEEQSSTAVAALGSMKGRDTGFLKGLARFAAARDR